MRNKWHYYDSEDSLCRFKYPWKRGTYITMTYCSREVKNVRRHTEFKDDVTCLQCLRKINKIEERRIN